MKGQQTSPDSPDVPRGLSSDSGRFVRLFVSHERRIRVYLFNLLGDRHAVDEVMQNVSTVLWEKFDQLDVDSNFLRWAYKIAKYEVLMYRRSMARDRLVLSPVTIELLTEDHELEDEEVRDTQRRLLDRCLGELADEDRELLIKAYQSDTTITALAAQLNRSSNSLYKAINRLRQHLTRCMRKRCQALNLP